MGKGSLKTKTINGVGWSAIDAFLGQGITFLVGLVLARLLSPKEYGLIGICIIFNTILNGIVDSGFGNAVIRKKEATDKDYSTMFITNLCVSVFLYIVLFACSPLIAGFFERPELVALIRVTGSVLIINALCIVQITYVTKTINFKIKTKASLVASLTSGVVGIAMAIAGCGVWSLAAQLVVKQLVDAICLWLFTKWRPMLYFSRNSFSYLWGFGWKMMLSGLLDNAWKEIYQIIVGKCYSAETLGQYTRSKEYARIFSANFTMIVQRVSYPVLAEIQDDKTRLISAYRKIIKLTMCVTCCCLIPMAAVAEPMIYCLIGPKWHEAATYLPFICVTLSLYPLHAINLNMLKVQGRSDIFLYLEIVKKIIALIPISLGLFIGIYWMLVGSIFTGIVSFFLNSYYTGKKLGYSSFHQLRDVAPSYTLAIVISLSVYFLKYLPLSYWIVFPMQLLLGFFVVAFVFKLTNMEEIAEIRSLFLTYYRKFFKKRNSIVNN